MRVWWIHAGWVCALGLARAIEAATGYLPAQAAAPPPAREFRGAWVATVNNIDWPSQPGLSVAQQKAELTALLDLAASLRLNAILLQVRPACDALYASKLEPWSEYLTGVSGQAPKPSYDPLEFAVREAHLRGLELHAWFNPYRARHTSARSPLAPNHVGRTRPDLTRAYGRQLWLDPGEPAVQEHSLRVILDVVRRYDVDGIHLDDYFYPYPEKDAAGAEADFPDERSWTRYRQSGGKLARGDWRRENVNTFIRRLYQETKAAKPWVKVGISPFGIWRPGAPAPVKGFDAYEKLYADSRRWLAGGWLDYCAPQLYWPLDAPNQSFRDLLSWWREQNTQGRHVWPGSSAYRAAATRGELAGQIRFTRQNAAAPGNILWSLKVLKQDKGGLAGELRTGVYGQPALIPACAWLDATPPARPALNAARAREGWTFSWRPGAKEKAWLWIWQVKTSTGWTTEILPAIQTRKLVAARNGLPMVVAVRAVDRCGNLSPTALLQRTEK